MAKKPNSIYLVKTSDGQKALVEASSKQAAINHIVGKYFTAVIPGQLEMLDLIKEGVQIDKAGVDASGQTTIDQANEQPAA